MTDPETPPGSAADDTAETPSHADETSGQMVEAPGQVDAAPGQVDVDSEAPTQVPVVAAPQSRRWRPTRAQSLAVAGVFLLGAGLCGGAGLALGLAAAHHGSHHGSSEPAAGGRHDRSDSRRGDRGRDDRRRGDNGPGDNGPGARWRLPRPTTPPAATPAAISPTPSAGPS